MTTLATGLDSPHGHLDLGFHAASEKSEGEVRTAAASI